MSCRCLCVQGSAAVGVCHALWQGAYMLDLLACCLGMHVKGVPRHSWGKIAALSDTAGWSSQKLLSSVCVYTPRVGKCEALGFISVPALA